MNLLFVNKTDWRGGAARMSANLRRAMQARGHCAYLAAAEKETTNDHGLQIPCLPPRANPLAAACWRRYRQMLASPRRGAARLFQRLARACADPVEAVAYWLGHELMQFPGSRAILDLPACRPDIAHLNNLHDKYFDLRCLPELCNQLPVFITLHDEWLLTGHCAAPLGCPRWQTGCGRCPDLSIYPAILRDGTRFNWRRKQRIYAKSRLYVATPSAWLMERARSSMLAQGILEGRVIPNGVEQSIFQPADRMQARRELGLQPAQEIALAQAAPDYAVNRIKDFGTLQACAQLMLQQAPANFKLLIIGSDLAGQEFKSEKVEARGYIGGQEELARYYQAADVYLHAAHSDIFPTTLLEALSCGTPVVATAVCGIPEQVQDGENGFLVDAQDAGGMARRALQILADKNLGLRLREGALATARPRFSLGRMADDYEAWYREALGARREQESGKAD